MRVGSVNDLMWESAFALEELVKHPEVTDAAFKESLQQALDAIGARLDDRWKPVIGPDFGEQKSPQEDPQETSPEEP